MLYISKCISNTKIKCKKISGTGESSFTIDKSDLLCYYLYLENKILTKKII